ncbi:hypothetical protein VCHA53O466_50176 [Vibrio chagasii]|nr:hypothetical protein VCHA53O466_50176 [Vibrio chagasii]
MAIWINSTEDFNNLVKRITSRFSATKRRDVEECIAPSFNYNTEHPALIASLKALPKTTKGFLTKKATTDFTSKLKRLSDDVTYACNYNANCESMIRYILAELAISQSSIKALAPSKQRLLSSLHDALLEFEGNPTSSKSTPIDIHTTGINHTPFNALEQIKAAKFKITWGKSSIEADIKIFDYMNDRYTVSDISKLVLVDDNEELLLSVHDESILSALMSKIVSPWAGSGAKPIFMPESLGLSPTTLNAVYRELMLD